MGPIHKTAAGMAPSLPRFCCSLPAPERLQGSHQNTEFVSPVLVVSDAHKSNGFHTVSLILALMMDNNITSKEANLNYI